MTRAVSQPVHRSRRGRRGVSLIEVVMAAFLLALTTTVIVSAITGVVAADARGRQKIESLELGNRLLLQYLDDKDAMPKQESHVPMGKGVYRWSLVKTPVKLDFPSGSIIAPPSPGSPGVQAMEKTELLTVNVYAGIPDGMGGYAFGERLCTLSRFNHPMSVIYRNPDTMARAFRDPGKAMETIMSLIQSMNTGTPTDAAIDEANAANGGGRGVRGGGSGGVGGGKPSGARQDRLDVDTAFSGTRESERGGGGGRNK